MRDKGGVEGEIGRFRRRHLVPVPAVASLAALNQLIAAGDIVDDGRVITGRPVTIAAAFAAEQPAMGPLPAEPFDAARLLQARVDSRARVCVRQNYYSVPARYAGRRLPVRLSATAVEVLDGPRVVATPPPRPRSAPPPASFACPPSGPRPPGWPRSPPGNAPPTWATSRSCPADLGPRQRSSRDPKSSPP